MGQRGKNSSFDQRQLVIYHFEKGKTYRKIAEVLQMKRNTVGNIIKRYRNEDRIHLIPQSGWPRIFTAWEEAHIVRQIKQNPKLSAPKLCSEIVQGTGKTANPQMVRHILQRAGFNGRLARKKLFVCERNRRKRLQFAKEFICKDTDWWQNVIFTDESKFNIFGLDGRTIVWRKANEEMKKFIFSLQWSTGW